MTILCDACLKPLDPELAHWDHRPSCPRSRGVPIDEVDCDCDLSVHPDPGCCRMCRRELRPLVAHKNPRAV